MSNAIATADRTARVSSAAQTLFRQNVIWSTFFVEMTGLDGIIREVFTTVEERKEFEGTQQYTDIQQMLAKLRSQGTVGRFERMAEQVITVRVPKVVHGWLVTRADEHKTSMNKLCISLLMQPIDEDLVPS